MEGELFDVAALERSSAMIVSTLGLRARRELVLRLYERFGEDFAAKLNGAFVVAIWDRRARKLLVVVNDRSGSASRSTTPA